MKESGFMLGEGTGNRGEIPGVEELSREIGLVVKEVLEMEEEVQIR